MTHKIYFLQRADGLIKIGTTAILEKRIHNLEKSHGPLKRLKIINGAQSRERKIQTRLQAYNEFGEWFRPASELLEFVDAIGNGEVIELQDSAQKEAWRIGEQEQVHVAKELATKLVVLRNQRRPATKQVVLAALSFDYGFVGWFLNGLLSRHSETISAFALKTLRDAYKKELHIYLDELCVMAAAECESLAAEAEAVAETFRSKHQHFLDEAKTSRLAARRRG